MGVVVVCIAMVLVAVVCTVRWWDASFAVPDRVPGGAADRFRRALWWIELTLGTVLFSGLLVVGAGGRLAMRLLGALAGDPAQGRLTEANEVVGEITLDGTISFFMFVGLLSGGATVVAYLLLRRYLPAGGAGGLAFGAGLLVVLGTRSDPIRPGNEDFDLVGPWWVALLVFAALALLHGAATRAFVDRFSSWLPLPGRERRAWAYLLLLAFIPLFPLALPAALFTVVYVLAGDRLGRAGAWLTSPRAVRVGRLALGALLVVTVPGFVAGVADIVGRGPGLG